MEQKAIVDGSKDERERLITYLEGLPDETWDQPSLCEGWRIKDVVAHLVGNLADVNALRLDDMGSADFNQRQVDERKDKTKSELLAEWREQAVGFDAFGDSLTPETWNSPLPQFPGKTLGWGAMRLLEDVWVHAHDVRLPLGDKPVGGPGLEAVLEVIADELPDRVKALAPSVGSVTITAGGTTRNIAIGEGVHVNVTGDAPAVALAGMGRKAEAGTIAIEPHADGFEDALNVYGPVIA